MWNRLAIAALSLALAVPAMAEDKPYRVSLIGDGFDGTSWHTGVLVEAILADRPHPEQGYRSCLGILRLAKRYGDARLEVAAQRARAAGAKSYRHVESILKHGLDRLPARDERSHGDAIVVHENLRGPDYYN